MPSIFGPYVNYAERYNMRKWTLTSISSAFYIFIPELIITKEEKKNLLIEHHRFKYRFNITIPFHVFLGPLKLCSWFIPFTFPWILLDLWVKTYNLSEVTVAIWIFILAQCFCFPFSFKIVKKSWNSLNYELIIYAS